MSKILACLDASIYAQSVADHAIWAAQRMNASVELVSTLGKHPAPQTDLVGAMALETQPGVFAKGISRDVEIDRKLDETLASQLEALERQLKGAGVAEVTTDLVDAPFLDTLAKREGDSDLVILGKRGQSADFVSLRLGSETERAARAIGRDVLIAARGFRRPRTALIAIEVGEAGVKLVERAAASPLLRGMTLHVVSAGDPGLERRDALEAAEETLKKEGFAVRTQVVPGPAERGVPWYVEEEDMGLLVMGASSHSRLRNFVLGSTTSELMRACKIPVLLLK
jgi:nucleotide-binding universal stress UspA family protein